MTSQILQLTPEQIVTQVCLAYDLGLGIFVNKENAEDMLPTASQEIQIQFLFWMTQMDYATKSAKLYENCNRFYEKNKSWLEPRYLLDRNSDDLFKLVQDNLKPRYPNEIVKRFQQNAQILLDQYHGKAIEIVEQSTSAQDLLNKIKAFRGFGDKLGNYLLRTYVNVMNLNFADLNEILPPVDVHDVRLTYEWGLVESKVMTTSNINTVKKIWSQACIASNKSWLKFDKALWLIGSKGERSNNPAQDFAKNLGLNAIL
jgi:endonuclease III